MNAEGDQPSAAQARLLDALGRALSPDPLPDGLVDRAVQLRVLRDLDSALVTLLEQVTAEPAGMRGDGDDARREFATGDGAVALELVPEPGRLAGQILAGDPVEVILESRAGTLASTGVDELGRFAFVTGSGAGAAGPVRLRLLGGATTPVTDWFLI
ncbi:hypothetical protein [Plantactinospora sp. GCM10030261]|uniref:hypothetical protein n=1 Tax=Plantactinospora sp. GCM10030261 TaxID=3273420 RepID=UPI00361EC902